jgi:hypothetical protein
VAPAKAGRGNRGSPGSNPVDGWAARIRPWFEGRLGIAGAGKVFDSSGMIIDDLIRERVSTFAQGFARFVAESRA